MTTDVFAIAAALRAAGEPFVLATVVASHPPQSVRPGAKAIIHPDGRLEGWVGGGCVRPVVLQEAAEALADGRPRLLRMNAGNADAPVRHGDVREYPMTCQGEGGVEIYLEPVLASPRLVVLGHTPVAQSLARMGAELGFDVALDRPDALAHADADAAVVVATMGAGDEEALAAAAASEAAYVGLVASRRKAEHLVRHLAASGVAPERLARVKYPAGLDLGGMTAGEVALSILAEIVQRRHERPTPVPGAQAPRSAAHAPAPAAAPFPVDPVCGMPVDPSTARHTLVIGLETRYFCCPHCKATYERQRRQAESHA